LGRNIDRLGTRKRGEGTGSSGEGELFKKERNGKREKKKEEKGDELRISNESD